jgi:hypothetical protein
MATHMSLIHTTIETIFAFATMQSTASGQLESTTPPTSGKTGLVNLAYFDRIKQINQI